MSIEFQCEKCGKAFAVPATMAGKEASCSDCGTVVVVPQVSSARPQPGERQPGERQPGERRNTAAKRPAPKKIQTTAFGYQKIKRKKSKAPLIWGTVGACAAILAVGGLVSYGILTSAEPEDDRDAIARVLEDVGSGSTAAFDPRTEGTDGGSAAGSEQPAGDYRPAGGNDFAAPLAGPDADGTAAAGTSVVGQPLPDEATVPAAQDTPQEDVPQDEPLSTVARGPDARTGQTQNARPVQRERGTSQPGPAAAATRPPSEPKIKVPRPQQLVPWRAQPDPPVEPVVIKPAALSIKADNVLFPARFSQFVLVTQESAQTKAVQVYNLRGRRYRGKHLSGEKSRITQESISPDGNYFAAQMSLAGSTFLGMWSMRSGKKLHELDLGKDFVLTGINYAAPGEIVLLNGQSPEPSIEIRGIESAEMIRRIPIPPNDEGYFLDGSFVVSHGGRYAAWIVGDRLDIFDLTNGQCAAQAALPDLPLSCHGIAISTDGTELAALVTIKSGEQLLIWDFATGNLLLDREYNEHLTFLEYKGPALEFAHDKQYLLMSGHFVLDRQTGTQVYRLDKTNSMARRMTSEKYILVGSGSFFRKTLESWKLPAEKIRRGLQQIRTGGNLVDAAIPFDLTSTSLAEAPAVAWPQRAGDWSATTDAGSLARRTTDRRIKLTDTWGKISRMQVHGPGATHATLQLDPTFNKNNLRILHRVNLASGAVSEPAKVLKQYSLFDTDPTGNLTLLGFALEDGEYERLDIVSLGQRRHVSGWRPYEHEPGDKRFIDWASFINNGQAVITLSRGGKLAVWSLPSLQPVYVLETTARPICMSPTRRYLIMQDGESIRILESASGKAAGDLQRPRYGRDVFRGTIRHDGREFAAILRGNMGATIARWDLTSGNRIDEFPAPLELIEDTDNADQASFDFDYRRSNYLLVDSTWLVDLKNKSLVWQYDYAGGARPMVGSADGRHWYSVKEGVKDTYLESAAVPSDKVVRQAGFIKVLSQILVGPGSAIGFQVRAGEEANQAGLDALKTAISQRIQEAGFVEDGQSNLQMELQLQRQPIKRTRFHFPRGPRFGGFRRGPPEITRTTEIVGHRNLVKIEVRDTKKRKQKTWEIPLGAGDPGALLADPSIREQLLPQVLFADVSSIIAGTTTFGSEPPPTPAPDSRQGNPGAGRPPIGPGRILGPGSRLGPRTRFGPRGGEGQN